MPDADTTPLALTAALIHEANRTADAIAVGSHLAKQPWEDQPNAAKERTIRLVERARSTNFEEFYEFFTMALRMAGHPVAPSTDANDGMVRHARMLHSIAHALVPSTLSN
ncbi:hypothetical protein [Streptomyces sp. NPDC056192]|uniref:hypothetical protein n=1 Tax=Streptomyces sp. NPDC056192 TaxID=3345743 RepID=UPI0035D85616